MKPKPDSEKSICIPRELVLRTAMLRLGNIDDEVQDGYNVLRKYHKTVTVFGSARTPKNDPFYQKAQRVSSSLAQTGYAVVTGGGHGIMEAANKGAHEAGGDSIGFNITLPHEQSLNSYTTESYAFQHFAPRKVVMTLYADAYVFFPGGYGTLDELSEILTLIQTGKTNKAPVILVGRGFWNQWDEFIDSAMYHDFHTITKSDEKLYKITNSAEEVVQIIQANRTYCDH